MPTAIFTVAKCLMTGSKDLDASRMPSGEVNTKERSQPTNQIKEEFIPGKTATDTRYIGDHIVSLIDLNRANGLMAVEWEEVSYIAEMEEYSIRNGWKR
jgi:hypothetical protein